MPPRTPPPQPQAVAPSPAPSVPAPPAATQPVASPTPAASATPQPDLYRDAPDLNKGVWVRGPNLPSPRQDVAAAVLAGRIYLIGGFGPHNQQMDTTLVWEPQIVPGEPRGEAERACCKLRGRSVPARSSACGPTLLAFQNRSIMQRRPSSAVRSMLRAAASKIS